MAGGFCRASAMLFVSTSLKLLRGRRRTRKPVCCSLLRLLVCRFYCSGEARKAGLVCRCGRCCGGEQRRATALGFLFGLAAAAGDDGGRGVQELLAGGVAVAASLEPSSWVMPC